MTTIAQTLRKALQARVNRDGLTATARAVGMQHSQLSAFLAGDKTITIDTADRAARVVGVTVRRCTGNTRNRRPA